MFMNMFMFMNTSLNMFMDKFMPTATTAVEVVETLRCCRSVEGTAVGADASGGYEGQDNGTYVEEGEVPVWPSVGEVMLLSLLKEVVALALMEEAEAPLVGKKHMSLKEVKVLVPLSWLR